ncbi:MAG: DUF962 domain-containing protein [Opitutaceae bacterium]|jgi:uncharacterized membrane protein YGL010W|nr:DUF962 domain-containing protein [Opitutaceae bacterium]MBP9912190.1 DUF962 domain-containing protein [Opitutaceae bacterium]
MKPRKTADQWFAEYGESHQHPSNESIHWICVPAIFFSVFGLIWLLPMPVILAEHFPGFRWTLPVVILALLFYLRLSRPLALGLFLFMFACQLGVSALAQRAPWPVWQICVGVFVLAWVGQFIGHKIEGKKPSFLKDLQFLLIGPAWLLSKAYRAVGLKY